MRKVVPSPGADSASTRAAVRLRDGGDDREAEARAAARAGARGVGAVEALEGVLELVGGHAGPGVATTSDGASRLALAR